MFFFIALASKRFKQFAYWSARPEAYTHNACMSRIAYTTANTQEGEGGREGGRQRERVTHSSSSAVT